MAATLVLNAATSLSASGARVRVAALPLSADTTFDARATENIAASLSAGTSFFAFSTRFVIGALALETSSEVSLGASLPVTGAIQLTAGTALTAGGVRRPLIIAAPHGINVRRPPAGINGRRATAGVVRTDIRPGIRRST
jgi:hypothetical protein